MGVYSEMMASASISISIFGSMRLTRTRSLTYSSPYIFILKCESLFRTCSVRLRMIDQGVEKDGAHHRSPRVMTMDIKHWLAVGLIPYSIKRQHTKNEQVLTVKALF